MRRLALGAFPFFAALAHAGPPDAATLLVAARIKGDAAKR